MKAQFADLPSGLIVPADVARQQCGLSAALVNQPRPDITVNSNALRNIGNNFMAARRTGAEIDVPEGARRVQMVLSDTMANVIGMSLIELAERLEEAHDSEVATDTIDGSMAKIEVVQ